MKTQLIALTMTFCSIAYGQIDSTHINTQKSDSIIIDKNDLIVPPLDSLYKWAEAYSFQIKMQEALIEKSVADTKRVQKQWLNAFKLNANFRTGNYGNTTINQVETGYSYGPTLSFSIFEIASQNNLVDVYQAEEKVASMKRMEIIFELRKIVTILNNNIYAQKAILKIRSEAMNAAYVHMKMAEKEFNEGAISIGELSRVSEIYSKAQADLEFTLNDLKNYYMQLEQFCGKSFSTLQIN